MNRPPPTSGLDERLRRRLQTLATRVRGQGLHRRSAVAWLLLSAAGLLWVVMCWRFAVLKPASFPVLALATLVVGWIIARWWRRTPYDYGAAATLVERDHPDLEQALRTALEQRPAANGAFHFLQRRVIDRAIAHSNTHRWEESRKHLKTWPLLAHLVALGVVMVVLSFSIEPPRAVLAALAPPATLNVGDITVTPGDAEIERGSTVVVAARFAGDLPRSALLVWTTATGGSVRVPMARSLSDPVYAFTLPRVENDVDYHVEYEDAGSTVFRLQVFDRPALVRADADLDYPEFTGLADRRIEDTRRISAVEGTQVDYQFMFNKPVRRATLRNADGEEVELTAANPERTRYALDFTVAESVRYTLHLQDEAARDNNSPPDIRIEALVNRRPDLKITFPRGDQRVSALEEIQLAGEARDDFGLLDYGLAISVGTNPARYISLRTAEGEKTLKATFAHALTLEPEGVMPDDLVTWFAWADDAGADGAPRRTESDPFFGEVRPFDEIFREQASAGGGAGEQQGGPPQDLLELQREIAIATWKLKQQHPPGEDFENDVETLVVSQSQAQTMLSEAAEQVRDPNALSAAADAGRYMDQARDALKKAGDETSTDPLTAAWSAAQGAYQALLRMQPRETNVSQSRNGQGGAGRNQRQINQLRMRNNEDNYESESQAQSLNSPEERERLEMLGRLKDLARRQQDINERLQQMQTALQEAATAEERDRIERELKRLEEEQRRMLSDLDDVRQRMDRQPPSSSARDSREQLDQTRESMREASESLQEGDVSQALAQGTKAQDNLEDVSDDLRKQSSSKFAEQLREARRAARELAESQQATQDELEKFDTEGPRSLDSSAERTAITDRIAAQRTEHERLVDELRQITEDSEVSEPGLHRQLYDLLRQHEQAGVDNRMEAGSDLLRRGFVDQSSELQPGITQDLEELRRGVERAAESVLGDETSTLRFAQNELDDLSRQLEQERPAGSAGGGEGEREGESGRNGTGGTQPGEPGAGQTPGTRPDDPGVGSSGLAGGMPPGTQPGVGEQPGLGQQPGLGEQPGTGGARPDDAGTGQSGVARGDQPGQQPGAGTQPGQQPGAGQSPGDQPTLAQGGQGQQPGAQPGQQPGPGQGQGQGQSPSPSAQPGSQPGGQGAAPGEGQGEGQSQGQGTQLAQGNAPGQSPGQGQGQGQAGSPNGQPGQNPGQGGQQGAQPGGQPGGSPGNTPGGSRGAGGDELSRALADYFGSGNPTGGTGGGERGPLTGSAEDYTDWEERLRTIEALLDSPEARARLAAARERAEGMRGEYRRHATPPQWSDVEQGVATPLDQVRTWLRQEIARREDPTALQPVDRDPVPERFEENVRKYYEELGR